MEEMHLPLGRGRFAVRRAVAPESAVAIDEGVRRWVIMLAAVAALQLASVPVQARCGVERWSVKTGTDAGASAIDIAHPEPTTIGTLIALPEPAPGTIPVDSRIGPIETTAWTVQATLVEFKFENNQQSGDSDYHLVLRDDQGNTLIAEVPSPDCVGGGSPFVDGISQSRQAMDSRFTASSSFQPVNLPVEVTGVGFFDFPHGQHGHAPNFIELHPVLAINFNPSGPTPTPSPTPTPGPAPRPAPAGGGELVVDGGFEDATTSGDTAPGWESSINLPGQHVIIAEGSYPHTGSNYAFMGNGNALNSRLEQSIAIPSGITTASLRFWVSVVTREPTGAPARDRLFVEIHDDSDVLLETPLMLSNRDTPRSHNTAGEYFEIQPIDLSGRAGTTIKLVFRAQTNRARPTVFRIDDVSLTVGQ